MSSSRKFRIRLNTNRLYFLLTMIYLTILLIVGIISCFFAYRQQKAETLSEIYVTYIQLNDSYNQFLDDFYKIYMPVFEDKGNSPVKTVLENYYNSDGALSIPQQQELSLVMKQLMIRDSHVQWLGLYSRSRDTNYCMYSWENGVQGMKDGFPYEEYLENKAARMEIYGMRPAGTSAYSVDTFVICGGSPNTSWEGCLLAGYSVSEFRQIVKNSNSRLKSLRFLITSNSQIVFDSQENYLAQDIYLPPEPMREAQVSYGGRNLLVTANACGNYRSLLSVQADQKELFLCFHKYTLPILGIVLAFALLSILIYTLFLQNISWEVNVIKKGLDTIAENNLDYQLPVDFNHSDLSAVAQAINQMTNKLHENINRAYSFELKQKEAELSDLQSKFNPHFLYNSLEMLRSRCYQNGDPDTAELIAQLAAIFRGLISSRVFIPFQEELAFSRRYFALLRARYGNQIEIRYDIESSLLEYGIIRNILQPLIENYFVHGFDVSSPEKGCICIRARSLDDDSMRITVEDNGCGMSKEELAKLNADLEESVSQSSESYGLKNLHRRLRLFYGPGCGLRVCHNVPKGLSLQMTVLKITCEEYENGEKGIRFHS